MTQFGKSGIRFIFVAAVMAITAWVAACGGAAVEPSPTATPTSASASSSVTRANPTETPQPSPTPSTRVVQHIAGETAIPTNPQRVVHIDSSVALYPLKFKPVGAWITTVQQTWAPADWFNGIEDVGWEPNLEKVAALRPDLIIGYEWHLEHYAQLSQIAPTIIMEFNHSGLWKEHARELADYLNAMDAYNAFLADYEARIADIKSRMPVPPEEIVVSTVRVYEDRVNLYTRGGFLGVILDDFGFKRPPSQDMDAADSKRRVDNPIQYTITYEELEKADGEVLILVITQRDNPDQQEQVNKLRQALTSHPLWSKLEAPRSGNVAEVGFAWIGSAGTAHVVLDDIERIFVHERMGAE